MEELVVKRGGRSKGSLKKIQHVRGQTSEGRTSGGQA